MERKVTYKQLYKEVFVYSDRIRFERCNIKLKYLCLYTLLQVNKLANGLKELGVKKGDRVAIYLPMVRSFS